MPITSSKKRFRNLLFIDVKTVADAPTFSDLDPRMQRLWEAKIGRYRDEESWTVDEWYANRASYYAEFGRIICIGIGGLYWNDDDQPRLKIKTLADADEQTILEAFSQIITRKPSTELTLCAHNGKEFDFPFLCRRMLVHGLELPPTLRLSGKKPWDIPHQDVLEQWQFGDKRHFIPLDLLAATLQIPSEPLPWSGDQTSHIYYREGHLNRIRQYTEQSIEMLVQVYLRMAGATLIAAEHIVISE